MELFVFVLLTLKCLQKNVGGGIKLVSSVIAFGKSRMNRILFKDLYVVTVYSFASGLCCRYVRCSGARALGRRYIWFPISDSIYNSALVRLIWVSVFCKMKYKSCSDLWAVGRLWCIFKRTSFCGYCDVGFL